MDVLRGRKCEAVSCVARCAEPETKEGGKKVVRDLRRNFFSQLCETVSQVAR